jgi:thiol-disulfide isomerase/thioredoxin
MKKLILLVVAVAWLSCGEEIKTPKPGKWMAVLEVQDNKVLPFIFEWNTDNSITIFNAEERITINDIMFKEDSITIAHPIFEGVFKGVFSEEKITGDFIKPSLNRVVPFIMLQGDFDRFDVNSTASDDVTGSWEMVFSAHSEEDRYIAKGIFTRTANNKVTGTIRTTTGDYRYLEGVVDGTTLKLSTFDMGHAFLFEAEIKDNLLYGFFYSGNHWKEPFSARRNDSYELPDANSLTQLNEGYDKFYFSFPDTEGNVISSSDERYIDKVLVVQIMGTWCPNCLEETQYYTEYLKRNPSPDLEFVALAFEYANTEEKAINGIDRLKEVVGVPYPILLAQYGSSSKQEANEKLPMLNHVLSYPTTIFIDRTGEVRKIHTGYNGKATREKHTQFTTDFENFLSQLLKE